MSRPDFRVKKEEVAQVEEKLERAGWKSGDASDFIAAATQLSQSFNEAAEAVLEFNKAAEPLKKSTHKAEVVPFVMEKHPDADSLSVVKVWGYTCVCRTEDWVGVDKAVYITPDSCVDVKRPEFSFLAEQAKADGIARVKAKKLRGIQSYGLLIPAPAGANIGDDLAEALGVTRYEPDEAGQGPKEKFVMGGEQESGPDIETGGTYDVDAFERYHDVFTDGEPVVLREKLDGSNVRAVWWNDRLWVKSRKYWMKRVPDYSHITLESLVAKGVPQEKAEAIVEGVKQRKPKANGFWEVIERTPGLLSLLKDNPGMVVYGEVFGNTNRIKYGLPEGNRFAAFDVFRDGKFLSDAEAGALLARYDVETAPELGCVPYSFDLVKEVAEGLTIVPGAKPGTIREGVVVRPVEERWDRRVGRVQLKCVNPLFIEGTYKVKAPAAAA